MSKPSTAHCSEHTELTIECPDCDQAYYREQLGLHTIPTGVCPKCGGKAIMYFSFAQTTPQRIYFAQMKCLVCHHTSPTASVSLDNMAKLHREWQPVLSDPETLMAAVKSLGLDQSCYQNFEVWWEKETKGITINDPESLEGRIIGLTKELAFNSWKAAQSRLINPAVSGFEDTARLNWLDSHPLPEQIVRSPGELPSKVYVVSSPMSLRDAIDGLMYLEAHQPSQEPKADVPALQPAKGYLEK
jgi:hypothetical protein